MLHAEGYSTDPRLENLLTDVASLATAMLENISSPAWAVSSLPWSFGAPMPFRLRRLATAGASARGADGDDTLVRPLVHMMDLLMGPHTVGLCECIRLTHLSLSALASGSRFGVPGALRVPHSRFSSRRRLWPPNSPCTFDTGILCRRRFSRAHSRRRPSRPSLWTSPVVSSPSSLGDAPVLHAGAKHLASSCLGGLRALTFSSPTSRLDPCRLVSVEPMHCSPGWRCMCSPQA